MRVEDVRCEPHCGVHVAICTIRPGTCAGPNVACQSGLRAGMTTGKAPDLSCPDLKLLEEQHWRQSLGMTQIGRSCRLTNLVAMHGSHTWHSSELTSILSFTDVPGIITRQWQVSCRTQATAPDLHVHLHTLPCCSQECNPDLIVVCAA